MQETANYGLSIYEPNDITSYMQSTGWNGTMEKIDMSMKEIENKADKGATDITTLEQQMATANDEINNLTSEVSDVTQTATGNANNIAGLNNRMLTAENDIQALQEAALKNAQFYYGTLSTGETTLSVQVGDFGDKTVVLATTNPYGVAPLTMELRAATSGNPNLCVMTFDAQTADVNVTVVIMNPVVPESGGN